MPALSCANLLLNPGFEADFTNWPVLSGIVGTSDALSVHSGSKGATIALFAGNIEQPFSVPDAPTLFFSAWIRLYTTSFEGNTCLARVTLELPGVDDVVLLGPVGGFAFSPESAEPGAWWLSDWILFKGIADLSGVTAGSTASIGISFLPGDSGGIVTSMFVDDVVVQHTPLPWAVSLLGSGLLGLLALRNKLHFR